MGIARLPGMKTVTAQASRRGLVSYAVESGAQVLGAVMTASALVHNNLYLRRRSRRMAVSATT